MQRGALRGLTTDTLILTATPRPRTLSLTLFGDLDVSFLDEMPPGRRCYIVYPLIEESEVSDLADATSAAEALQM